MGAMKVVDPDAWTYAEDAPYAWRVLESMPVDPDAFRSDVELAQLLSTRNIAHSAATPVSRSAIRDVVIASRIAQTGSRDRVILYRDEWPRLHVGLTIYSMLLRASGVVLLSEPLRQFALRLLRVELAEHVREDPSADPWKETQDISIMRLVRMIDEVGAGTVAAPDTKSRLWHLAFVELSFAPRKSAWEIASSLMRHLVTPSSERAQEAIGLALLGIGEG